jgi:hypothetical protein
MTRRVLHSGSPVGALAARYLAGTNLERAADHNQRITLHAIRLNGPTRLNERLASHRGMIPAIAPVARAAMSDDAPAVGAGILPFSERFLPTRFALMKCAS